MKQRFQADVLFLTVVFCLLVGWALLAGKDVSWDYFNHHLYLPFSLASGRYATDLFAAGPQSFQNPLAYLPAYWLVTSPLPAWLVTSILASAHFFNLFLVHRLASRLWRGSNPWAIRLSVLAAGVAPVFLQLAGTTSIDPWLSIPVLGALLLVFNQSGGDHGKAALRCFASGVLLGGAFALKPSNAVYCLAVAAVLLGQLVQRHLTFGAGLVFVLGGMVGAALAGGAWAYHLWEDLGNPLFPLYNNLFKSPYFPTDPILAQRFVVMEPLSMLLRLFEMAELRKFIYTESFAPDLRPAAMCVLLLFAFLYSVRCRWRGQGESDERALDRRADVDLALFIGVGTIIWLMTSGNGRYALPLLLLVGLVLVRVAFSFLTFRAAVAVAAVGSLLQFAYFLNAGEFRNRAEPNSARPYVDIAVAPRLRDEPFLHLMLGLQTNASVLPFLHPQGAATNPIGQYSLPLEGPLGERFANLLAHWKGRVRVMLAGSVEGDNETVEKGRKLYSHLLYRLNMDVDWADCLPVVVSAESIEAHPWFVRLHGEAVAHAPPRRLLSCGTTGRRLENPTYEGHRAEIDRIFALLEEACPQTLGPRVWVTERGVGKWQRYYAATDTIVTVDDNGTIVGGQARNSVEWALGNVQGVLKGQLPACRQWSYRAPD